jgi:hypothetical protein
VKNLATFVRKKHKEEKYYKKIIRNTTNVRRKKAEWRGRERDRSLNDYKVLAWLRV